MVQLTYGERTLRLIVAQCESRGIPIEELDMVLDAFADANGVDQFTDLDGSQMKSFVQNIDGHFRAYLGGAKRAPGAGNEAWPADVSPASLISAAKAGVVIGGE